MGREMPKDGERLRATADCQQVNANAGFCKTAAGEAGMNLVCRQSLMKFIRVIKLINILI